MDRKEWKNLAAWKHLELTLACLGKMFRGLGSGASDNMDEGILKLLFKCICHENRYIIVAKLEFLGQKKGYYHIS